MSRTRILGPALVVVLLATLTACLPLPPLPQRPATPSPSTSPSAAPIEPTRIDEAAVEDLMMAALPTAGGDFEVEEERGMGELTFGSDWAAVDYNALRAARSVRIITSPGWNGAAGSPSFQFLFELVHMGSEQTAAAALNDFALSTRTPSTSTADDGSSSADYQPAEAPTGRWPFGTVEQTRQISWTTGETAVGWGAHFAAGPFIAVVYSSATPDDPSVQAMNAFADEHAPAFIAAVQALPGLTE